MPLPKLTIQYLDDSLQVVDLKASSRVAWERHFQVPFMSMLIPAQVAADKGEDPSGSVMMEHILYLGYVCLDPKADPEGFDAWLDTVAQVAIGDATADETAESEAVEDVPLDSIPTPSP